MQNFYSQSVLKLKANVIVSAASGFLSVSNIYKVYLTLGVVVSFSFSAQRTSSQSAALFLEISYDCTWTFKKFCLVSIHHLQKFCQPDKLTSVVLRLHFLYFPTVYYYYFRNNFILEPNNYLLRILRPENWCELKK